MPALAARSPIRSEEHTSELQSLRHLVCRLLLEKKKNHVGAVEVLTHAGVDLSADLTVMPADECAVDRQIVIRRASDHQASGFFFFNDPATTEIYPLSLPDALPICQPPERIQVRHRHRRAQPLPPQAGHAH